MHDLERFLGKQTLEVGILKEALGAQKRLLLWPNWPGPRIPTESRGPDSANQRRFTAE